MTLLHFEPPLAPRGRGNLIVPLWQKSLIFGPKIFWESFITLASKLTILKINPIALLNPPSSKGGREFNFAYLAKKVLYLALENMWKVL